MKNEGKQCIGRDDIIVEKTGYRESFSMVTLTGPSGIDVRTDFRLNLSVGVSTLRLHKQQRSSKKHFVIKYETSCF